MKRSFLATATGGAQADLGPRLLSGGQGVPVEQGHLPTASAVPLWKPTAVALLRGRGASRRRRRTSSAAVGRSPPATVTTSPRCTLLRGQPAQVDRHPPAGEGQVDPSPGATAGPGPGGEAPGEQDVSRPRRREPSRSVPVTTVPKPPARRRGRRGAGGAPGHGGGRPGQELLQGPGEVVQPRALQGGDGDDLAPSRDVPRRISLILPAPGPATPRPTGRSWSGPPAPG